MSETSYTTPTGYESASSKKAHHNVFQEPPVAGETSEFEERIPDIEKQKTAEGQAHFHRLGWKRLTVVLIVEAIALGSLSLPAAFATLGMVPAVILCITLGLIAIYTSDIVGKVKLKFPEVAHYADATGLVFGRWGYEICGVMFVSLLVGLVGSHCLTGTIALATITDNGACSLVFAVVSAIILLILAIPPSFTELAILGYIDFVSVFIAIGITMIATGIDAHNLPGGMSSVDWSMWPRPGLTVSDAFIAVTDIVFAYSFSICQFSFMDEMHTPPDYIKSIWALGLIEICIYTLTGAIIYAFVGSDVQSPALLSAGTTVSKIAFGVGLPVIFISGSINATTAARYLHGRIYKDSILRFINTPMGWATWIGMLAAMTVVAFIIAEAVPFFSDLLSIWSALFVSGFTFYFPAIFWFVLLREGSPFERKNLFHTFLSGLSFIIGIVVLVGGTYSSINDIILQFKAGTVRSPFTCGPV